MPDNDQPTSDETGRSRKPPRDTATVRQQAHFALRWGHLETAQACLVELLSRRDNTQPLNIELYRLPKGPRGDDFREAIEEVNKRVVKEPA